MDSVGAKNMLDKGRAAKRDVLARLMGLKSCKTSQAFRDMSKDLRYLADLYEAGSMLGDIDGE